MSSGLDPYHRWHVHRVLERLPQQTAEYTNLLYNVDPY